MNPETNRFYVADQPEAGNHIPFSVGEEVMIKGHIFEVVTVDIPKNPAHQHLLVLTPKRKGIAMPFEV